MPIRLRLTLWYGLLLASTLLVFCVALYLALGAALERDFDQTLRVRAAQVERELVSSSSQDDSSELSADEIGPDDLEPAALEDFAEPGVYVQVLTRRGEVLATSGTTLPIDLGLVGQAADLRTPEGFETLVIGDRRLRTLYWPVRSLDHVIAIVQVAETLQILEETLQDARNLMLGGTMALLAAALGSGWFLTSRALAPVAAVTETARHIAQTGTFERRLGPTTPSDEMSALVATFDMMIGRLEDIITKQRQLLADTSHELRNPLSIIRGNLDFARRVTTDQACLESLREAEVEATRMSRLVNDLLLLAEADAGDFLAPRAVRLDVLGEEVAERARALAPAHRIEVTASAEIWIRADPDRLRQVLWNLVENALRYTPAGGSIALSARTHEGEAVLDVSDSGPGVPAGQEQRIFERFYRSDPSRTRTTGGVGLGLAIVKHVVEAHGGRVALENRPGRGATFSVALPLMLPPDNEEPGIQRTETSAPLSSVRAR
jgi:two-component system OmpR family sensor kinase